MILITGATGANGRELVKALSAKSVALRTLVHKVEDADARRSTGSRADRG